MTTRDIVERYFDRLDRKDGWESSLADDLVFTSFTSPPKQIKGKQTFLQATKRFYSMIAGMQVRDLMVSGDRACALTHYELTPPSGGPTFASDVAEIFDVRDGRIDSLEIYFDSSPFPK